MTALFFALALQASVLASAPTALASELRTRDQALLDAVAVGNRAIWDETLTPDAVVVDENGQIISRTEFLKTLTPLPAGVSGHIVIVDHQVRVHGDAATVIHRDDEREDYHGQRLEAGYLSTETWVRRAGKWKLAMLHYQVMTKDPPPITIPAAKLDQYAGRYRAAADLFWVIRRDGDHLEGGREGASSHPLLVEALDVLFMPGQPRTRKIFQRNPAGQITGFLDRREGQDVQWTRVTDDSAQTGLPGKVAAADPSRDMITELAARGPHSSLGPEAHDFDRMVGTWDCDFSFIAADGSVSHTAGELRFGWILDGRAVQDIWIGYPKSPNGERTIGTSVRFFDTSIRLWRIVFIAPAFNGVTLMQGGTDGDRIVLRGQDTDGSLLLWTFNELKADSFTWRGERSRDGGKNWTLEEQHHMKRRLKSGA